MPQADYLNHDVMRGDCHYIEAYGLYYTHTQTWTHSYRGYLAHGPHF